MDEVHLQMTTLYQEAYDKVMELSPADRVRLIRQVHSDLISKDGSKPRTRSIREFSGFADGFWIDIDAYLAEERDSWH